MKAFQMTHEQYKDAAQYWGKKASASMPEAELKNACRDQRIVLGFQGWVRQQTDKDFTMKKTIWKRNLRLKRDASLSG